MREGEVSPVELVETYLERIERLDPALGAYVTVRGEEALAEARTKAGERAEAPFHGVPISLKDLDTTAGIRTTFSSHAFAAQRARLRPRARRAPEGGRLRRPRQDEHARVRHDRVHRLEPERPVPDAVGSRPKRRRLERRRRSGARGRAVPDRAGLRRRRLDQDPRLLLRRPRLQALARADLGRAVRARGRARHDRPARPHDGGRGRVPRRRLRLRVGRPLSGAAARPPVRRGGRERPWPPPRRPDDGASRRHGRRRRLPSRQLTPRPSCSPRSATRSRRSRPTGAPTG